MNAASGAGASLPNSVRELVYGLLTEERRPQWIRTDPALRVVDWFGEDLTGSLSGGCDLSEALPCLIGAEDLAPITFPSVNLDDGRAVDVHLFAQRPGYQVLLLDSSEAMLRRRAEQQKSNEIALLNHRLNRLTTALRAAKKEAEAASLAKTRFIAGMSHELRTPLTSILGYSDLIIEGIVDDPDSIKSIREAAAYLLGLVDNLLEHGAIEEGHLSLATEVVELKTFFESLGRLARALAERHGLSFELSGPREDDWRRIDPLRVRQILFNLISNAVRYTPHGSVSVRWRTEGNRLQVEVEDTGIGIEADRMERIFVPFARESTAERHSGLGLGLSIVRRLAEGMGGGIKAVSEPGEGSLFTVQMVAEAVAEPTGSAAPWTRTRSAKKILVVDDDTNIRAMVSLALEEFGYRVEAVPDRAAALAAVKTLKPDLAMVDLDLHGDSGLELIGELRRDPTSRILAMSATTLERVRIQAVAAGCLGFVEKPFDFPELNRVVSAALRTQPPR